MKIVQTPVRFYPAVGGVEKHVFDLSRQLVESGHQVAVFCADEPPSECCEIKGIRVCRLPFLFKVADTNITPSLFFRLIKEDFDLIHTHFPTPWSAEISLLSAKIKKKPCILTYHNDVEKAGFLGLLTRIYNRVFLQVILGNVDKILITQPRYIEDSQFLKKYQKKIAVITNGISEIPAEATQCREKTTVLFVGILDQHHRYKGLGYLIEALCLLKEDWPDIRLEVIGKGELVKEYQELADHLGVIDHIHFHGYVDDQRLSDFYRTSTIFVLPSIDLHEGFGIVLLEAMAHGMPVITTDVVGLSDQIKAHDAGNIVPKKDPSALAKAIEIYLSDSQIARETGENGKKLVQDKYMWKEICKQVVSIYESAVR